MVFFLSSTLDLLIFGNFSLTVLFVADSLVLANCLVVAI